LLLNKRRRFFLRDALDEPVILERSFTRLAGLDEDAIALPCLEILSRRSSSEVVGCERPDGNELKPKGKFGKNYPPTFSVQCSVTVRSLKKSDRTASEPRYAKH